MKLDFWCGMRNVNIASYTTDHSHARHSGQGHGYGYSLWIWICLGLSLTCWAFGACTTGRLRALGAPGFGAPRFRPKVSLASAIAVLFLTRVGRGGCGHQIWGEIEDWDWGVWVSEWVKTNKICPNSRLPIAVWHWGNSTACMFVDSCSNGEG